MARRINAAGLALVQDYEGLRLEACRDTSGIWTIGYGHTAGVKPGDSITVQLTAKSKTPRNEQYGEVRWQVVITNQNNETCATYELLTMNAV